MCAVSINHCTKLQHLPRDSRNRWNTRNEWVSEWVLNGVEITLEMLFTLCVNITAKRINMLCIWPLAHFVVSVSIRRNNNTNEHEMYKMELDCPTKWKTRKKKKWVEHFKGERNEQNKHKMDLQRWTWRWYNTMGISLVVHSIMRRNQRKNEWKKKTGTEIEYVCASRNRIAINEVKVSQMYHNVFQNDSLVVHID